jgi:hypothetical protein
MRGLILSIAHTSEVCFTVVSAGRYLPGKTDCPFSIPENRGSAIIRRQNFFMACIFNIKLFDNYQITRSC